MISFTIADSFFAPKNREAVRHSPQPKKNKEQQKLGTPLIKTEVFTKILLAIHKNDRENIKAP